MTNEKTGLFFVHKQTLAHHLPIEIAYIFKLHKVNKSTIYDHIQLLFVVLKASINL